MNVTNIKFFFAKKCHKGGCKNTNIFNYRNSLQQFFKQSEVP